MYGSPNFLLTETWNSYFDIYFFPWLSSLILISRRDKSGSGSQGKSPSPLPRPFFLLSSSVQQDTRPDLFVTHLVVPILPPKPSPGKYEAATVGKFRLKALSLLLLLSLLLSYYHLPLNFLCPMVFRVTVQFFDSCIFKVLYKLLHEMLTLQSRKFGTSGILEIYYLGFFHLWLVILAW